MHVDSLSEPRLVANQPSKFCSQSVRESLGKSCEKNATIGMKPRKINGTVQSNNRLTGAGSAGYTRRTCDRLR